MVDDKKATEETMEDILSSIRETVEEEVSKTNVDQDIKADSDENSVEDMVQSGDEEKAEVSDDVVDEKGAKTASEDIMAADDIESILELTDIVESTDADLQQSVDSKTIDTNSDKEELVDIDAFEASGEITDASEASVKEARNRYNEDYEDKDISEEEFASKEDDISLESKDQEEAAKEEASTDGDDDFDVESLLEEFDSSSLEEEAEDEPSAEDDSEEESQKNNDLPEISNEVEDQAPDEEVVSEPEDISESSEKSEKTENQEKESVVNTAVAEKVVEDVVDILKNTEEIAPPKRVHLRTVPGPTGLQLNFPAEILAEALRPLVKDWLEENLSDIVERLVKEELSKLADK